MDALLIDCLDTLEITTISNGRLMFILSLLEETLSYTEGSFIFFGKLVYYHFIRCGLHWMGRSGRTQTNPNRDHSCSISEDGYLEFHHSNLLPYSTECGRGAQPQSKEIHPWSTPKNEQHPTTYFSLLTVK